MSQMKIIAIKDGWSEERRPTTRAEALIQASCLWDSGKYELVTALSPRFILFYRQKHFPNVGSFREKRAL